MRRREFLARAGTTGGVVLGVAAACRKKPRSRTIIVGAGFAGASCARALRALDDTIEVVVVERRATFFTGPYTNAVVAGLRAPASIRFSPKTLQQHGISVVLDEARAIDPVRRSVTLGSGRVLRADWLVVAPGIELLPSAIPGLANDALAAWTGGADVETLAAKVAALPEGAVVAIGAPSNPYRCPPGPYERASLIAARIASKGGKVIVCDAKDDFTKRALFALEWDVRYRGVVEWVPRAKGGRIVAVEGATLELANGERLRVDLASIVPPQRAAPIARAADLVDPTGWCPVRGASFESARHPQVYVLGDAAIAHPMPKSATSAFGQGKLAAIDIVRRMRGLSATPQKLINTCYSLTTEDHAISVSAVYRLAPGEPITSLHSAQSALAAPDADRKREAVYAGQWYDSITGACFG